MKILNWLKEHKILLLIVAIGAFLRIYKLDYQSLWIDEIFSILQSSPEKSFGSMYKYLREFDPHPPLYYFSLHGFLTIFGDTTWVARFFSATCGIAGIFAIYYLAKEFLNKKVGLIAALITSINYFHLIYSQEARMYSLMFLATTVSFLYLSRFIKVPNRRNMILYSLFATLMIYTQFFTLFTLFAQYIILLYFTLRPYKIKNKQFLILSFCSGIITLILYIPALLIFIKTSEMQSIWIQMPSLEVYTNMFKEFFGFAEILLFIVSAAIICFLLKLLNRNNLKDGYINPDEEKQVFTFFIILIWISITLLIPLIASYVNLPMIVSRYFINILPAIIILVAAGLYYIKNGVARMTILSLFIIFSFTDIFIVKDYYNKITKSQFRELTTTLKERSKGNTKVVAYWSWLLPYFFEDTPHIKVHGNTLEEYALLLKSDKMKPTPFWYVDGHSRPYSLTPESQAYLDANYVLKEKMEYFDCWANYYVPIDYKESMPENEIALNDFKTPNFDNYGNLMIFENSIVESELIQLDKGKFQIALDGQSLPNKPLKNENAHLRIKINNQEVADFYLSEKDSAPKNIFEFEQQASGKVKFQIQFDNDYSENNQDRNVMLKSFKIEKR